MLKKMIIITVLTSAFFNVSYSASNRPVNSDYKIAKESMIGDIPKFNLTEKPMYGADFMLLTVRQNWLEWYKNEFKKAKRLGYNAIILLSRADNYYTYEVNETEKTINQQQIKELYNYAINDLDIEVIPELFIFARGSRCFSQQMLNEYPDLIIEGKMHKSSAIWNPLFRFPDNKDIYEKVIFPLIDRIISFYGDKKPRFFHLGFDELDKVALKKLSDKVGMPPEQVMANELNIVTNYLLAKGITPIIWGDMLISSKLAESNYGLENVTTNPNFKALPSLHGGKETKDFLGDLDVVNSVKYITNKDKIIVFDWHYTNATVDSSYPSIDFFQQVGFRNVLGTTWFDEDGIRSFSKYVAQKKGGGMIASFWHHVLPITSKIDETYNKTINNSIIYFKNPEYKFLENPTINIRNIIADKNEQETISIEITEPLLSEENYLLLRKHKINDKKYQYPEYDKKMRLQSRQIAGKTMLTADFKPGYYGFKDGDVIDMKFCYYTKDKLYQFSEKEAAIIIGNIKNEETIVKKCKEKNLLYDVDFNPENIINGKYLISQGEIPQVGFYDNADKGLLYFAEDTAYGTKVNNQMTVDLTVKFNNLSNTNPKALFSWGEWNKGVRIFIWGDKIEFQSGFYESPLRLRDFIVKKNTWYNIRAISDYKNRKISLYVDQKLVSFKDLQYSYSFNSGEQGLSNFKVCIGFALKNNNKNYISDNTEIKNVKVWNKALYYNNENVLR